MGIPMRPDWLKQMKNFPKNMGYTIWMPKKCSIMILSDSQLLYLALYSDRAYSSVLTEKSEVCIK